MEVKEEGRVSAYVSPEAKAMLREMAHEWFPGLKRPMGAALERIIRETYHRRQQAEAQRSADIMEEWEWIRRKEKEV